MTITRYQEAIKQFEGFSSVAKWDYKQHTNGYGTKAEFPGERITPEVAEARFQSELANAREIVEKNAGHLDEGARAALTSLTFNAGDKWVRSGLGDAIRANDIEKAKELFLKYTKAGGQDLPGLVKRRFEELAWFGAHDSGAGVGATTSAASLPPELAGDATSFAAVEPGQLRLTNIPLVPDGIPSEQSQVSAESWVGMRNWAELIQAILAESGIGQPIGPKEQEAVA